MKKTSTPKKLVLIAIGIAAVIGISMLTGAASKEAPVVEPVSQMVVETTTPQTKDIIVMGEYIGTVEPNQQAMVYPKVTAEVLAVNFQVGDTVEVGDVLFELDSTLVRNNIAQTQATISSSQAKAQHSLEMAKQKLEEYQNGLSDGYNTSIMQAEDAVESAEISLQQAIATLRSATEAYRDYKDEYGDYSDDEYSIDSQLNQLRNAKTQAEIQVEGARLKLEQSEASLDAVKKQVAEGTTSAENSVKTAELATDFSSNYISLQQLQNDLRNYTITSTIGGIVEQCNIDPHDMASPQTAAFVISNKDAMTVSYQVAESTWRSTQLGDIITIEKEGSTCAGTVTEMATMASAGSGLYTIKASVENAPFDMPTGSFVKVFAEMQGSRRALTIPMDVVYYDGGTPYVLVYDNGISIRKNIEAGISDGIDLEVLSGLQSGATVITTWNSTMTDGTEVVLLEDYQASLLVVEEAGTELEEELQITEDELQIFNDESDMDISVAGNHITSAGSEGSE